MHRAFALYNPMNLTAPCLQYLSLQTIFFLHLNNARITQFFIELTNLPHTIWGRGHKNDRNKKTSLHSSPPHSLPWAGTAMVVCLFSLCFILSLLLLPIIPFVSMLLCPLSALCHVPWCPHPPCEQLLTAVVAGTGLWWCPGGWPFPHHCW